MTPDVSFACDGRGNRTYDGTWATAGAFQETTEVGAELEIAVVGESIDLTLGNGVDHGICDIYVNSVFWGSLDTYSDSASEETVTIELNHRGPHVLRIRNTGDEHLDATGHKLRFKQVVLPVEYDVHTIQYTYDALSRLMAAAETGGTTSVYG